MSPARHRRLPARAAPLLVAAGLAAALSGCDAPRRSASTLPLADCRLPRLSTAALCGTLAVPEDRTRPGGRTIDVFVAVLPANSVAPRQDPLVLLAGGPGQAATQLAPLALRFSEIRRNRDIVLIDPRGAGRSSPLACDALKPRDDIAATLDIDPVPSAQACVRELTGRGVDLRHYTTEATVADIEAVRDALGYPALNLWGGSYGSRVALAYLRRHPDRVRTLVLDGVAPPGMAVPRDIWFARERALDAAIAACAASAACRERHPDLDGTLQAILRDLGPDGREVAFADPRTGRPGRRTVTPDHVLAALHALTYAPQRAALMPEVVGRAASGDYAPLIAVAEASGGELGNTMSVALHYSVICTEDAPRVSAADRARLESSRSRAIARAAFEVCAIWPTGEVPPDAAAPVRSDVPALLLSGAIDPVTPPSFGAEVAATLPNARHVVATGQGHIVSTLACAPRLIAAFVEAGSAKDLPEACVDFLGRTKRSPPWPDAMGPQP